MRSQQQSITLVVCILILSIGVVFFAFFKSERTPSDAGAGTAPASLGVRYTNDEHRFSFTTPDGYTVREAEDTILIENEEGEGVQILITSLDEDIPILTEERVRSDIPDMLMTDVQTVEIGEDRSGIAFKSNNEAFGCDVSLACPEGSGASREVWFVFNGMFYQISTYERLDALLKSIFATWEFK